MKGNGSRNRIYHGLHRWLGILSALFLFVLALTGLALNHTERLGLDRIKINSPVILARYGMNSGSDIRAWRIHESDTVAWLDGRLYFNASPISSGGPVLGIVEGEAFSVLVCPESLLMMTRSGELVERIQAAQLPLDRIRLLAMGSGGEPVLVADNGQWQADPDWMEFSPYDGAFTVIPLEMLDLDEATRLSLLQQRQGAGVSLYRVILDLHSGRLLGWGGRTVMDLTAVAILLLLSSGISGWFRNRHRPR